ncbi:hypothetical protein GE061_017976 [Apolygus lucorum]|uniref:Uncharacterized protein n=1 Tax=Apolygus lucorum TaxID=248454 RepID=A0A8S9XCE6_APOLU|nr:hypothetical protein GE061_017976 [Apolygus lucorum]
MLLRNFSSCRFRVPSLRVAGRSTNLGSPSALQKCDCGVLDLQKRGLSEKIRDPKDYTRYSGRPDDPPKKRKWLGRPDGPCEQKRAEKNQQVEAKTPLKWTGRPEDTCTDQKLRSPETANKTKRRVDRPENTNKPEKRYQQENAKKPYRAEDGRNPRKWTGRPEETCGNSGKREQAKSLTPSSKSDGPSESGPGFDDTKASIAAVSLSNISTPAIQSAIVNVEMPGATGLPPPDSLASTTGPSQNSVPTSCESERINVDDKLTEKVIAIQGVVSTQLGEILGQSKPLLNGSIDSKSTLVATSSLEHSATSPKIGGWFPDHNVAMPQRPPVQPTRISPDKLSTALPELEQLKPLGSAPEPQTPEIKRAIGRTSIDVKIPGAPKLKVVKEVYNEKRRHRVYSFGLSETGALGLYKPSEGRRWRKFISRPLRHQFAEETRVISAEAGYGFSLFYVNSESNVKLYGCGINTDFQLGPTDAEIVTYPSPIDIHINSKNTKIASFSAGRAHSVVATDNEGVFLFGSNSYGQCGRTLDEEDKTSPTCTITQIKNFAGEKVAGVSCGQDHTCFVTASGKVYSCGWGAEGQTGLGHSSHSYEPCLVQGAIKGENIVKVTGKCDTVLALNEKGELFGWGSNEFRQIVDDKDLPQVESPIRMEHVNKICGKIVDIGAGSTFCLVLNHEGDVYVWGHGILGGGPELERTIIPTLLPRTLFGTNEYTPKVVPLRVYCGLDHMAVMNSLNHVYSWGKNKHGCLGIGIARDQYFPYKLSISANAVHVTCAVDHSVVVTDHS